MNDTIVAASDLQSGCPLYLTNQQSWESDIELAIQLDATSARTALELTHDNRDLVDPYLVAIDSNGKPQLLRERIRLYGPTLWHGCAISEQR